MTATRPAPTAEAVEAPTARAVAAMPSTALTSIEREVFPDNLGGTVQGVKAEWFSRGYETALSSDVIGDLIAEALRDAAIEMSEVGAHRDPCRLPDTSCLCGVCDFRAEAMDRLRARAAALVHTLVDGTTSDDTLHEWLHWRFGGSTPQTAGQFAGGEPDLDDEGYWRHQAAAVRRAVARGGWRTQTQEVDHCG